MLRVFLNQKVGAKLLKVNESNNSQPANLRGSEQKKNLILVT